MYIAIYSYIYIAIYMYVYVYSYVYVSKFLLHIIFITKDRKSHLFEIHFILLVDLQVCAFLLFI